MTILKPRMEEAQQVASLRRQVAELERECEILTAQLEGNIPSATFWLQGKVTRQRAALDALNRTVVSQRFVLRTLEGLGRSLTREEYRWARNAEENEQLRDRIEDPDAK